jgi:putative spermidine/putrescine transport system permease protein
LSLRWYGAFFTNEAFVSGVWNSLVLGFAATLVSAIIGTMAALAITNYDFRGKALVSALFLSPLMIPAVVVGLALLVFFSRAGIFQRILSTVLRTRDCNAALHDSGRAARASRHQALLGRGCDEPWR